MPTDRFKPALALAGIGLLAFAIWQFSRGPSDTVSNGQLVVYCAHDAAYAEQIIQRFEQQTGIPVDVRFDEEASKSLGLTNLLIAEKNDPRCDVFWNNQTLGTIRLKSAGLLQSYHSPNADRIPSRFKDADDCWTGFAGRLRVYLVNTDNMAATVEAVDQALAAPSLNRVAIAKPLFGTTLSHYSVLQAQWGEARLREWHTDIRERGIREVRGNSMTKDLVAAGVCDVGFTDTDDAYVAIDNGHPVAMLPVRLDDGSTICLPNSVAIIRNSPHPELAEQFVDFLLSAETELLLASSSARQIPLGPVDDSQLTEEVRELKRWADEGIDLTDAANQNQRVLDWLTTEHTGE